MKKLLLMSLGIFCSQIHSQTILEEGFEGATFPPNGWTTFIGTNGLGTSQNWKLETQSVNSGTKAAYVQYQNVTNGQIAEDWMVTSEVDLSTATTAELSFFTRKLFENQTSSKSTYYIKVSETSQTQHDTFVDVQVWPEVQLVTTYNIYEKKTVDLSAYAGKKVFVAFVMTNDNGNSWFVDDVKITSQSSDLPAATLPYNYGFETEDGWKATNLGSGNNWTIEETNSFYAASEGTKNARYRFSDTNAANAWYVSRGVQLTKNVAVEIKFDYKTGGFEGIEKLKLAISNSKNPTTFTNVVWDNNGGSSLTNTAWETATVVYTPTEDGVYYLGFNAYSEANQMYVFIDNVKLAVETLAVNQTNKKAFSFYPNPVSDKITLKSDVNIAKFSLYSLDGKLINETPINNKVLDVKIPQVAAGSYLGVVYFSDGTTQTIKLLKK